MLTADLNHLYQQQYSKFTAFIGETDQMLLKFMNGHQFTCVTSNSDLPTASSTRLSPSERDSKCCPQIVPPTVSSVNPRSTLNFCKPPNFHQLYITTAPTFATTTPKFSFFPIESTAKHDPTTFPPNLITTYPD